LRPRHQPGRKFRRRFRDRSRRANGNGNASENQSKHGAVGRSDRIVNAGTKSGRSAGTVSDRLGAISGSNRVHAVNVPSKAASNLNRVGTTLNRPANKAGHVAIAPSKTGTKLSHVGTTLNKAANSRNRGGKVVGDEVEEVEAEVANRGMTVVAGVKAIAVVAVVAMTSRTGNVGANANVNRNEKHDRRRIWKKWRQSRCRHGNRRKSRLPLVYGTRSLVRPLSKRRK
jgi:hypothetical protein